MKILELSPDKEEVLSWLNDVSNSQRLDVLIDDAGKLCLPEEVLNDARREGGAWKKWKGFLDSLPVREVSERKLRPKNSDPDPLGLLKNLDLSAGPL